MKTGLQDSVVELIHHLSTQNRELRRKVVSLEVENAELKKARLAINAKIREMKKLTNE